jgi:hypothetical protein
MKQHVISEWLLRAFARGRPLSRYDKVTREYDTTTADDFLTQIDAHSVEVEQALHDIETPASEAGMRLRKQITRFPPGLYAVTSEGDEAVTTGPEMFDGGMFEPTNTRLLVSQRTIPSPSAADRLAIARYVALMYQRGPKMEAAMLDFRRSLDQGAQAVLDRLLPGMQANVAGVLTERRGRMTGLASETAPRLAAATWWVYRVRDGDAFILGDMPVPVTLSLGHEEDVWHGLLSDQAYAIVLPLGPAYALLIAPQRIIPFVGITTNELPATVNRMMLRWADRYVVARERRHIEAVVGTMPADGKWDVPISIDRAHGVQSGVAMMERIYVEIALKYSGITPSVGPWWEGCAVRCTRFPWAAEDRPYIVSLGLLGPACPVVDPSSSRVPKRAAA